MVNFTKELAKRREKLRLQVLGASTHYELLGVPPAATTEMIRGAHRYLASAFHPDRCHLGDAQRLMAAVNVAYDCLTDPVARRKYDAVNHTKKSQCQTCDGQGSVLKQRGFKAKERVPCPTCGGTGG